MTEEQLKILRKEADQIAKILDGTVMKKRFAPETLANLEVRQKVLKEMLEKYDTPKEH